MLSETGSLATGWTRVTNSTLASSLPSAVAAAKMEAEDEEDDHQARGRLREAKKVTRAALISIFLVDIRNSQGRIQRSTSCLSD